MDNLQWGMQNLHIAQILTEPTRNLDEDDLITLDAGIAFLRQSVTIAKVAGTERLQAPGFSAQEFTATLQELNFTRPTQKFEALADTLTDIKLGRKVSAEKRRDAERFFAHFGSAAVSESASAGEFIFGEDEEEDASAHDSDAEYAY